MRLYYTIDVFLPECLSAYTVNCNIQYLTKLHTTYAYTPTQITLYLYCLFCFQSNNYILLIFEVMINLLLILFASLFRTQPCESSPCGLQFESMHCCKRRNTYNCILLFGVPTGPAGRCSYYSTYILNELVNNKFFARHQCGDRLRCYCVALGLANVTATLLCTFVLLFDNRHYNIVDAIKRMLPASCLPVSVHCLHCTFNLFMYTNGIPFRY